MITRRRLLKGTAAAATAATFSRVGNTSSMASSEWQTAVKEARGQSLNLMMDPRTAHRSILQAFERNFPEIKVKASIMNASDAAPRILTEQKNGLFAWDAWWGLCSNMNSVVLPANGFDPITDYLVLPDVKDTSGWLLPEYRYTSKRGPYVFVHTHFLLNYGAYNTSLVPGGTLTLDNITNPTLKRKISIRVPNRPHGGSMTLAQMAKAKSLDYVENFLNFMDPIYVDNDRQNMMSVMRGDSAVGIGTVEETLYECHINGGCKTINPFPVSVMHSRGISVLRNAPNKAATKVWVNWLLSKEGQETYVREWAKSNPGGALSMRKDVAGAPAHSKSFPDFQNADQYVAVSLDSGWKELQQIFALYKKLRG